MKLERLLSSFVRSSRALSAPAALALVSALSLAVPASSQAGGENKWACFGHKVKGILQKFHDPYTKAALATDFQSFRQTTHNHSNILVVPMWRMKDMPNPIAALRAELPELAASGVTGVYFPPMYEQMVYGFTGKAGYTPNNHGYWPRNFDVGICDPKLGCSQEYLKLLEEMKALKMDLTLDVVPRHLGYVEGDGDTVLFGRKVNIKDSEYFITRGEPTTYDFAQAELHGPKRSDVYTDTKMWDLPAVNLENPWVRKNMIEAKLKAIDMGFTTFRIDAVKHLRSSFVRDLLKAMTEKAKQKGVKLKFFLEYFSGNYGEIAWKLGDIGQFPGLQFIDFRGSAAVKSSVVDGNSFHEVKDAVKTLEELELDQGFLVQTITDMDGFYPPIYHGDQDSANKTIASLALSNLSSTNRPYYVAGLEQAEAVGSPKNFPRKFVDRSSPVQPHLETINKYLNDAFPRLKPMKSEYIVAADHEHIVIKRPFADGKRSLLLVIDKSRGSHHIRKAQSRFQPDKQVFRWGEFGGNVETYLAEVPN